MGGTSGSDLDSMTGSWPTGEPPGDAPANLILPALPSRLPRSHRRTRLSLMPIHRPTVTQAFSTPKPTAVPGSFAFSFTPQPSVSTPAPLVASSSRPPSPAKSRPSAAFARPVTRPSSKKCLAAPPNDDESRPSPAKRQKRHIPTSAPSTKDSRILVPSRAPGVKALSSSCTTLLEASLCGHHRRRELLLRCWEQTSSCLGASEPGPERSFNGYRERDGGDVNMEATELWCYKEKSKR
jgi:hypothetical protein